MTNIINMEQAKEKKQAHMESLWVDFREKMERAQETLDMEDGFAAGRAWKAFLEAFE